MDNIFKNVIVRKIYGIIMTFLAIISVIIAIADFRNKITISEEPLLFFIDMSIYLIFAADYLVRLIRSKNKLDFIEDNILDLIAIIPYYSVFRLFRIFKIRKFSRISRKLKISKFHLAILKLYRKSRHFLKLNGLIYLLVFAAIAIAVSAVIIAYTEKVSYGDGLWWAFVTATTVGYGDISPHTFIGRFAASILMLVGIGTMGMITGTVATYFLNRQNDVLPNDKLDEYILNSPNYSDMEKREIISFIQYIRSKRKIK